MIRHIAEFLGRFRTVRMFILGSVALLTVGFCILTNSQGYFRKYLDSDIPFVYRVNSVAPAEYYGPIERGANQWNAVESSYWLFERGLNTDVSSAGRDGINLLLFDVNGVNFAPGTSTIAFSRSFTTGGGSNYHALESDLVWNARDFPPSPTGQRGQQDLQSVIAHEFGHHLGLGHQGTPGSPPGCGPSNTAAVMYGLSASGDTSNRVLHPEDVAGASTIYPSWVLSGTVTMAATGEPVENARIRFLGGTVTSIGAVETPGSGVYERPGLLLNEDYTSGDGSYAEVALQESLAVVVQRFGTVPDTAVIVFGPPGGIGQTEVIVNDVALEAYPEVAVTGTVSARMTGTPVLARLELMALDQSTLFSLDTVTTAGGEFSFTVHSGEAYRLTVRPEAPYPDEVVLDSVFVSAQGEVLELSLPEAEVLLVADDQGGGYASPYQQSLDRIGALRRTLSVADSGALLSGELQRFTVRPVLVWMTGDDTTDAMTAAERALVLGHLEAGGSAVITGQNIAEFSDSADLLLERTLGIRWTGNVPAWLLMGFGGDPIGNRVSYSYGGGAGNQRSADRFELVAGSSGAPTKTLYHKFPGSDTTMLAGARIVGPGAAWCVAFYGFGLEGLPGDRMDSLLTRSLRFFDQTVTTVAQSGESGAPSEYHLAQNYPNPFNPTTTIQFSLPVRATVSVVIFDVGGRRVRSLLTEERGAGRHAVSWDARDDRGQHVSSGVYFYRLEAAGIDGSQLRQTRKMILVQ